MYKLLWLVTLLLGAAPAALAQTLLVANKAEANVSLVDLGSGAVVATAATGDGPHEIAVSRDGTLAVVSNYGTTEAGNSLTVIELPAGKAVGTIDLGQHTRPHGLQFLADSRHLLVTAEDSRAVLKVDVLRGTIVAVIPTGQRLSHMLSYHASGRRALVSNMRSGSVSLLNIKNGELLSFESSGAGAEGIALNSSGSALWVSNRAEDTVSRFDAVQLRLLFKVAVPGFPLRVEVTPDDKWVLVTSAKTSVLNVIDAATGELARQVELSVPVPPAPAGTTASAWATGSIPIGIEIAPDNSHVWISHSGAGLVQELALSNWQQTRIFKVGKTPDGMGYSPLSVRSEPARQP